MKKKHAISDFEIRCWKHYKENEFDNLLDAVVDYCELKDVDYDNLLDIVDFTTSFLVRIEDEAIERNLVHDDRPSETLDII